MVVAYNVPVALRELIDALQVCKLNCEGTDDIHFIMLKHVSLEALVLIFTSYNKVWTTGHIPLTW